MKANVILSGIRKLSAPLCITVAGISLAVILSGCGSKQTAATGDSKAERIRQGFFADQKATDLNGLARTQLGTPQGEAWELLTKAGSAMKGNRTAEAKEALESVKNIAGVDTCSLLWASASLRALGQQPDASIANKPQGVVIELNNGNSTDTLAVYADGTYRFFDATESIFYVTTPKQTSKTRINQLLALTQSMVEPSKLSTNRPPMVLGETRLTVLTFGGNYAYTDGANKKAKWTLPEDISGVFSELTLLAQSECDKSKTIVRGDIGSGRKSTVNTNQ